MSKKFVFWFDIENAPDVLFFEPIAKFLLEMKHKVYLTYRNYSGLSELVKIYALDGDKIGWFGGKNKAMKIAVGLTRSYLLSKWSKGKKIDFAVGFGSRPLAVACRLVGIPNATIFDYEHVSISALGRFCQWVFVPEEVSSEYLASRGVPRGKVVKYAGLKEEVYTDFYAFDSQESILKQLCCDKNKTIVTIRPPATKAHYHDHKSEKICRLLLERISNDLSVQAILVTRDKDKSFNNFLERENILPLKTTMRGLDLIAISDVVVSGGGTMVREASALGVPAFSIFTGKEGAVDRRLAKEGKLSLVRSIQDVDKIVFKKRDSKQIKTRGNAPVRDFFVGELVRFAHTGKQL